MVSATFLKREQLTGEVITNAFFAAPDLVQIALDNGADGFMFLISDTTLSMIENLH